MQRLEIGRVTSSVVRHTCRLHTFCRNGGLCKITRTGWKCDCRNVWIGPRCTKKNVCPKRNICQNGGRCVNSQIQGIFRRCKCRVGFYGRYCEKIDHCVNGPCRNGGQCASGASTFICKCAKGYMGKTCDDIDHCANDPCVNNGQCTSGSTTFTCKCPTGFKGERCEEIDYCANGPCRNGGQCTSSASTFTCKCAKGYMGKTCDDIDHCADDPCVNNGQCTSGLTTFTCKCPTGFKGQKCEETDYCVDDPCKNGGQCISGSSTFTCKCATGYYGKTCDGQITNVDMFWSTRSNVSRTSHTYTESGSNKVSPQRRAGPTGCEIGWTEYNRHCYFYSQTKMKWNDAKADCDGKASYLIELDDQKENDWITQNLFAAGGSSWAGARDDVTESVFLWQQFHTEMAFTNWVPGEPNNGVHAQCLHIRNNGKWSDAYCTDQFSFICEKPI